MVLCILVFLLFSSSMHAMEFFSNFFGSCGEEAHEIVQKESFNLEGLPSDIQNEIARYFTFPKTDKDDNELIERTKALYYISKDDGSGHFIRCLNTKREIRFQEFKGWTSIQRILTITSNLQKAERVVELCREECTIPLAFIAASDMISEDFIGCSPYMSKVVHAEKDSKQAYKIKIYDAEKRSCQNIQNQRSHELFNFDLKNINQLFAITVDLDGEYIAYVMNNNNEKNSYVVEYRNCNNIDFVLFSEVFQFSTVSAIHFNKQGTEVIIYDNSNNNRTIVQLVNNETHTSKSQKTLREYFAQRGICKNLKCAGDKK